MVRTAGPRRHPLHILDGDAAQPLLLSGGAKCARVVGRVGACPWCRDRHIRHTTADSREQVSCTGPHQMSSVLLLALEAAHNTAHPVSRGTLDCLFAMSLGYNLPRSCPSTKLQTLLWLLTSAGADEGVADVGRDGCADGRGGSRRQGAATYLVELRHPARNGQHEHQDETKCERGQRSHAAVALCTVECRIPSGTAPDACQHAP